MNVIANHKEIIMVSTAVSLYLGQNTLTEARNKEISGNNNNNININPRPITLVPPVLLLQDVQVN